MRLLLLKSVAAAAESAHSVGTVERRLTMMSWAGLDRCSLPLMRLLTYWKPVSTRTKSHGPQP